MTGCVQAQAQGRLSSTSVEVRLDNQPPLIVRSVRQRQWAGTALTAPPRHQEVSPDAPRG